ncbi:MAG: hypothetical protein M1839_002742 [Geoglossum umbratile]|nr:MAG: hypothetical protein M1839_002742 [Geoglossum umbratile]
MSGRPSNTTARSTSTSVSNTAKGSGEKACSTTSGPPSSRTSVTPANDPASGAFREFLAEEDEAFREFHKQREKNRGKIQKYIQDYIDIEGSSEEIGRLKLAICIKDTEIQTLKSTYKKQWETFNSRFGERAELQRANARLEKSVRDERVKIEATEKELATLRGIPKQLEMEKTEAERRNQKIYKLETDLKEWDSYVVGLKAIGSVELNRELAQLFNRSYRMASKHFSATLPEQLLSNRARWATLRSCLAAPLPIPTTNTPAAKLCRQAAALHIISAHITTKIFKPCYLHETPGADEAIKEVLRQQSLDETKLRITRAFLLMYPAEIVNKAILRTINTTVSDVVKILSPILGDQTDEFRADLNELLREAVSLWRKAQYSREMVEARTEKEDYRDWKWLRRFGEFDDTPKPPTNFGRLNLFPYVYFRGKSHDIPIYEGIVLWSDQKAVTESEEECRKSMLAESQGRGHDNGMVSEDGESDNE